MSKDRGKFNQFLCQESVLTIASADACGPWSAPVLYVADISIDPFALYFLSSANSRHIQSLPVDGAAALSIYSDYDGHWQSIRGAQIYGTIAPVDSADEAAIGELYFTRFSEIKALIDRPQTDQEMRIGDAFGRSNFYRVTPSFVRFTNNGDSFAARSEWQL